MRLEDPLPDAIEKAYAAHADVYDNHTARLKALRFCMESMEQRDRRIRVHVANCGATTGPVAHPQRAIPSGIESSGVATRDVLPKTATLSAGS